MQALTRSRIELWIALALLASACGGGNSEPAETSGATPAPQACVGGDANACRKAGAEAADPAEGLQYYERGCTLGDKQSCQAAADGWRSAGDEAKAKDFEQRAK